jgi:putative FmdB family regulatory protein
MITYEYKCSNCGDEFEVERKISEKTSEFPCGSCGSIAPRHFRTIPHVDTYWEGSYKAEACIAGN